MSASPLNATTRRIHAVAGRAFDNMPVRRRATATWCATGTLNAWGATTAPCAHVAHKAATKANYIKPIDDGVRLPRGTG